MSEKIYQGPSEGFAELVDGYVDYAEEIIVGRAVPDLRDGLKKVNRRILYAMHLNHKGYLQKAATMVGEAMKYHPHGDSSIYGSMTLMTDENGSYNVSPLHGMGSLGKVSLSEKPAHMRYTKVSLQPYTEKDYFEDQDVMHMVMSEEGILMEPEVLNVTYPVVLVNGASGIAVAAGTKMASFNFKDVLELTLKYLKAGELTVEDMIYPDFPTGGVMVCNKEEIAKMMLTGKGKVKLRARVDIEGDVIIVKEVPFGKTAEYINAKVKDGNFNGVKTSRVSASKDPNSGYVKITCKSKRIVEEVLMQLYSRGILQSSFSSSILVINGKEPEILGVYGVIEKWCEWRKSVVIEKATANIESIKKDMKLYKPFINLVGNQSMKDTFVDMVVHQGRKAGMDYLMENLEDCDLEVAKWIADRGLSVFHTGGTYAERYESSLKSLEYWESCKDKPEEYIINQLTELLTTRGNDYPRKTELTLKDYKFSKIVDSEEIEDDSNCVYTIRKDGFLAKTRNDETGDNVLFNIHAQANSILIGFDNFGRILRVIGKEIPYTASGSDGIYLPKYFGVEDEAEKFDYKVLYMCLLDGSRKMLLYRDGYIGFFDTSEYMGKKNIKVVAQGVCIAVGDKLLEVIEEANIPDYLLLADNTSNKVKIGIVNVDDIPERSRTSRAKVLSGTDINTEYWKGFRGMGLVQFISEPEDYIGKCKVYKGTWYGDPSEVKEGFYLDMCKDIVQ